MMRWRRPGDSKARLLAVRVGPKSNTWFALLKKAAPLTPNIGCYEAVNVRHHQVEQNQKSVSNSVQASRARPAPLSE
jgi:hypothetical protein